MKHFPRLPGTFGLGLILTTLGACGGYAKSEPASAPTASGGLMSTAPGVHEHSVAKEESGGRRGPERDGDGVADHRDSPSTVAPEAPPPPAMPGGGMPAGGPTGVSKSLPDAKAPSAKPKDMSAKAGDDYGGLGASGVGIGGGGTGTGIATGAGVSGTPKVPLPPIPRPVEKLPPISLDQESKTGGILTAAIWDDNKFRDEFATFLNRYPSYKAEWGLEMGRRVILRVEDSAGVLVGDAALSMRTPDGQVINLRTHGDGMTYYFPGAVPASYFGPNGPTKTAGYSIAAQVGTLRTETVFAAPTGDTNTWTMKLPGVPVRAALPALDVAIVLDTTGSMGDEIGYIQREVEVVIKRAKLIHGMRRLRLGLVLYKDRGDEYVTKTFPFTEDLATFNANLRFASSGGGGDTPESVNEALSDTVKKLAWSGDETGRLAVLIADAPPHFYPDEKYTYKNALVDLNSKGIKLITLGASGIDKSCEYLFRQMSAYTGSRYVFLTDDSGVGGSHILPDISGYQVERLDRILVRVISDEAKSFDRK